MKITSAVGMAEADASAASHCDDRMAEVDKSATRAMTDDGECAAEATRCSAGAAINPSFGNLRAWSPRSSELHRVHARGRDDFRGDEPIMKLDEDMEHSGAPMARRAPIAASSLPLPPGSRQAHRDDRPSEAAAAADASSSCTSTGRVGPPPGRRGRCRRCCRCEPATRRSCSPMVAGTTARSAWGWPFRGHACNRGGESADWRSAIRRMYCEAAGSDRAGHVDDATAAEPVCVEVCRRSCAGARAYLDALGAREALRAALELSSDAAQIACAASAVSAAADAGECCDGEIIDVGASDDVLGTDLLVCGNSTTLCMPLARAVGLYGRRECVFGRRLAAMTKHKSKTLKQIPDDAKKAIDAFLQHDPDEADAYEFQSGGVMEMLEKLLDKFIAKQFTWEKRGMNSKHAYDMLMQDLKAQIVQATQDRDEKSEFKAETLQSKTDVKDDLKDTNRVRHAHAKILSPK